MAMKRCGLIATLMVLATISLARPSNGQSSGTWAGIESYSIYEYTDQGQVLVGSGTDQPATFSTSYDGTFLSLQITGAFTTSIFGPSSDGMTTFYFNGDASGVGFYDATTAGVVANIETGDDLGYSFATFLTVPEPSTFVQATFGLLSIGLATLIRRRRRR
jgi:MYXO-CTERM domain-containing protein